MLLGMRHPGKPARCLIPSHDVVVFNRDHGARGLRMMTTRMPLSSVARVTFAFRALRVGHQRRGTASIKAVKKACSAGIIDYSQGKARRASAPGCNCVERPSNVNRYSSVSPLQPLLAHSKHVYGPFAQKKSAVSLFVCANVVAAGPVRFAQPSWGQFAMRVEGRSQCFSYSRERQDRCDLRTPKPMGKATISSQTSA